MAALFHACRLAVADLCHSWVLSLCVSLALGSVIAPILILLGLKNGVIASMREDLAGDPQSLEITPRGLSEALIDEAWLKRIRARHDVQFIMPNPSTIARSAEVKPDGSDKRTEIILSATAAGDPLLLKNGAPIPREGEVTLSAPLATELGLKPGGRLRLYLTREYNGSFEEQSLDLVVAGIAGLRAARRSNELWLPLATLEMIEDFQSGMAVDKLGGIGSHESLRLSYAAAVTVSEAELPNSPEILNGTGFATSHAMDEATFRQHADGIPTGQSHLVIWEPANGRVTEQNLRRLATRIKDQGMAAQIVPWPDMPPVRILDASGKALEIRISPQRPENNSSDRGHARPPLLLYAGIKSATESGRIELPKAAATGQIPLELRSLPEVPPGVVWVPPEILATLSQVAGNIAYFDSAKGVFLPRKSVFNDFRAYATSLEDVIPLTTALQADLGIELRSETREVIRIQQLDRQLRQLYLLVASVTGTAALLAFAASIFGAVERRLRAFAHLSLLGFSRRALVIFPCFQALILTALALVIGWGFYRLFALALQNTFSERLSQKTITSISPTEFLILATATSMATLGAAALAGLKILRMEPAKHLRDE